MCNTVRINIYKHHDSLTISFSCRHYINELTELFGKHLHEGVPKSPFHTFPVLFPHEAESDYQCRKCNGGEN